MPQVITEEAVRATVEERQQEMLVYRDAFRDLDASDINNSTLTIPNPDDVLAEPDAIAPASEYPTTRESYTKIDIDRQKYGRMIEVPEEDVLDNVFDLVADHVDLAAREMAEFLDGEAFAELNNNLNSTSPVGDANGTLSYDDILAGLRALEVDSFSPDMVIVEPNGKEDLLSDADFTRSTDLGDEVVTNGQIGTVAGLDVMVSNTGDLGNNDAFVVDSDRYGYEATWTPVTTERDDDFDTDVDKIKIKTRKGWKAIKSGAAIKVDG